MSDTFEGGGNGVSVGVETASHPKERTVTQASCARADQMT
jgi:hypothetical protein